MAIGRRSRRVAHHRVHHGTLRGVGVAAGGLGGDTSDALGGAGTITFPGVPLRFRVMIALDADPDGNTNSWIYTDITRFVLYENKIRIRRGQEDQQSGSTPTECTLTLKNYLIEGELAPYNVAGIFSPRNPRSPFYGKLRRNIPIKIDVNAGTGWVRRYTGFVAKWPPKSELSGNFRYVTITASGRLRRLATGNAQSYSYARYAVRNQITSAPTTVNAYWSLEDLSGATQAVSDMPDVAPMVVSGIVNFASAQDIPDGIAAAPSFTAGGKLTGTLRAPQNAGAETDFGFFYRATGDGRILELATSGSLYVWAVSVTSIAVIVSSPLGVSTSIATTATDGQWHAVFVRLLQSGGNVNVTLFVDEVLSAAVVAGTVGVPTTVQLNPFNDTDIDGIAQLYFYESFVVLGTIIMNGSTGQRSGQQAVGISSAAGISLSVAPGSVLTTERMGPQSIGNYIDVLKECIAADEATLVERLNSLLGFDTRASYENQAVAMSLDHAQRQIFRLDPEDDDLLTVNDFTMTRKKGSSFNAFDDSGPLGRIPIGTVPDSDTLNLQDDARTLQHAWYRIAHGTVDEARFPRLVVHFSRPGMATVLLAWLSVDLGDRIKLLGPMSADMAPQDTDQLMIGYTEILDQFEWVVELTLIPYSPYRIFRLVAESADESEFAGFLMTDACTLAEDLDTTETFIDVTTSDSLWSTASDDWWIPVPINVGGEIMLVTGVTGSANPQTLEVVRGALHSPAITHSTGASVAIHLPGVLALQDETAS